jgi:hypothetical protein
MNELLKRMKERSLLLPENAFSFTDEEWRALMDRFRQVSELRMVVICLPQEITSSNFSCAIGVQ